MNINSLWNLPHIREIKIRNLVIYRKLNAYYVPGTVLCTRVQSFQHHGSSSVVGLLGSVFLPRRNPQKMLAWLNKQGINSRLSFFSSEELEGWKRGNFLTLCRVKWCYHLPHMQHVVYGTVNWSWRLKPSDRWDMAGAAAEKQGKIAVINIWKHTDAIWCLLLLKQFSKFEMIPLINHRA